MTWQEKLEEAAERVCGDEECNHASADGYMMCLCCLHGGCYKADAADIEAKGLLMQLGEDK